MANSVVVLVLLVVGGMVGLAAARPVGSAANDGLHPPIMSPADDPEELNGLMECVVGCFTQVLGCAFGCMGKGADLPLCVVSCNQNSIVCMVRCAITPPPPSPKPTPPPPTPKPKPSPPGPPYAGHTTETFA
ncbi:hypothetical protein GUJ93_ZPchr0006g44404 [Zizania palustris]|uniref:Uncharacterized protein n=1 Tax=Zizania palustris TaxID=103762 RepID=A0A8J5SEW4_ZIZPA|nr:hypothetical protein GUJ93_ZPchr0006g44404 [Zizania palustris]